MNNSNTYSTKRNTQKLRTKSTGTLAQHSTTTRRDILSLLSTMNLPKNILSIHGYKKEERLSPTLQGEVFIASSIYRDYLLISGYIRIHSSCLNNKSFRNIASICYKYTESKKDYVIKRANKSLHRQRISITDNGSRNRVCEDIVKESQLMRLFRNNNPPKELIKYYGFFADDNNYYLIMERGGIGLFEFVVECHKYILNGKLSIKEWRRTVRIIFAKMVKVIRFFHKTVFCCNLDISLENVVMARNTYFDEKAGKIKNIDIRFIDFGLSEQFNIKKNPHYKCSKFVGKSGYKCPQIYNCLQFMANKADIWSLGSALFMMSIGAPLFQVPGDNDPGYQLLKHGGSKQVIILLQNWDRLKYIGKNQFNLLMKMLCIDEDKRIDIDDIMKHEWIKTSPFINCSKKLNNDYKNNKSPLIATSDTRTVDVMSEDIYAFVQ